MKLPGLESERIWITGMPFSGKSSAARKLASLLHWQRTDTDAQIEKETGRSVPEIFASLGELEFRRKEKELTDLLCSAQYRVISTGGGLPVFYGNMDTMLQNGTVVFLNTSVEIIAQRSLEHNDRPLVRSVEETQEARVDFFRKMLFERLPYYGKAHYTFGSEKALLEWGQTLL